uniref:Uncharacterized protein n=1 Tax=Octopus bimaculoides TaxID=37653 RepID=A0A0L8H293_OCTBM
MDTADTHIESGNCMLCTFHVRELKSDIKMKRITQRLNKIFSSFCFPFCI